VTSFSDLLQTLLRRLRDSRAGHFFSVAAAQGHGESPVVAMGSIGPRIAAVGAPSTVGVWTGLPRQPLPMLDVRELYFAPPCQWGATDAYVPPVPQWPPAGITLPAAQASSGRLAGSHGDRLPSGRYPAYDSSRYPAGGSGRHRIVGSHRPEPAPPNGTASTTQASTGFETQVFRVFD
jgi:hypothetical protein